MNRPGGDAHAVSEGAAAAHDDIAVGQLQPADRPWVERQQAPEVALADAETVQRRGMNVASGKATARTLLVVEKSEHWRLRKDLCDRRKGALGAAHNQQVVVDESDIDVDL